MYAVIVFILCISCEIDAKTNTASYTSSKHLDGDFNELTAIELSTQIDNCHEACLQKVCVFSRYDFKSMRMRVCLFSGFYFK